MVPMQFYSFMTSLGMVSYKMSLITIFGHKHFKQKFATKFYKFTKKSHCFDGMEKHVLHFVQKNTSPCLYCVGEAEVTSSMKWTLAHSVSKTFWWQCMVSHKISKITTFGHKHFKQKFDILKQLRWWFIFKIKLL